MKQSRLQHLKQMAYVKVRVALNPQGPGAEPGERTNNKLKQEEKIA